jgi:hypothetical protein
MVYFKQDLQITTMNRERRRGNIPSVTLVLEKLMLLCGFGCMLSSSSITDTWNANACIKCLGNVRECIWNPGREMFPSQYLACLAGRAWVLAEAVLCTVLCTKCFVWPSGTEITYGFPSSKTHSCTVTLRV